MDLASKYNFLIKEQEMLEKWLIVDFEQEKYKISLKEQVVPGSNLQGKGVRDRKGSVREKGSMGEKDIHNGWRQLQAARWLIFLSQRTEECHKIRGRRRGEHWVSFKT